MLPSAEVMAIRLKAPSIYKGSSMPTRGLLSTLRQGFPAQIVAFSPTGQTLAAGGIKQTGLRTQAVVKVWAVATPSCLFTVQFPAWQVSLGYVPSGNELVTTTRSLQFWDAANGELKRTLFEDNRFPIVSFAFSADERWLAVAIEDGMIQLLRYDTLEVHASLKLPRGGAILSFPLHNCLLAAEYQAHRRTIIQLWELPNLVPYATITSSARFRFDGSIPCPPSRIALISGHDATIRFWDVSAKELCGSMPLPDMDMLFSQAFSPDGRLFAAGGCTTTRITSQGIRSSRRGVVTISDVQTGSELARFEAARAAISYVTFSPNGTLLATRGSYTVQIWDVARLVATTNQLPGGQGG
jgi:WD40 repeat protein